MPRAAREDGIGDDREVINGHQRPSTVINGQSEVIRGHQRSSEGHSVAYSSTQRQSVTLSCTLTCSGESTGTPIAPGCSAGTTNRRGHKYSSTILSWSTRRNSSRKKGTRVTWASAGAVVSTCMQGACGFVAETGVARVTSPPEVIRGHQRSSEVIRGHQRSSVVISGHQNGSARYLSARYAHVEPYLGRRG